MKYVIQFNDKVKQELIVSFIIDGYSHIEAVPYPIVNGQMMNKSALDAYFLSFAPKIPAPLPDELMAEIDALVAPMVSAEAEQEEVSVDETPAAE